MRSELYDLTRKWARLIKVEQFADPDLDPAIAAISLSFDAGVLHMQAQVDDDTFVWLDDVAPAVRAKAARPTSTVWDEALGKLLMRAYEMENHNGYRDAVQFEFYSSALQSETIIQVRVEASVLRCYRVAPAASGG